MFKRLFRAADPPQTQQPDPPVDRDTAFDDLELRVAREQAAGGDWRAAQAVIEAAGADWERRGHRIGVLSQAASKDDAWLNAWLDAVPDDAAAAALAAAVAAERASEARGAASAARTSQDQFRSFAELMSQAEVAARRAIELAPDDPTPWVEVLWSMFPEGRRRRDDFAQALAEARKRDPYNFAVHHAALHFSCEKWYGSHEEMYERARAVAAAAPPGAASVMLPIEAHLEYVMREFCWDGKDGLAEARAFFRTPELQRELDACVTKWRSPGPPQHASAMKVRHLEAVAYVLSGRKADLKGVMDEIGPYLGDGYPWYYFYGLPSGFYACWHWSRTG